jgi:hypothetical protein
VSFEGDIEVYQLILENVRQRFWVGDDALHHFLVVCETHAADEGRERVSQQFDYLLSRALVI